MAKKTSPMWAYLTVMLAALVGLAMTPLANAQGTPSQSDATQNQGAITATGCLQKAPSGSGYQLTDSSSMKTYDLTASSSDVDLSAHVGHTVTVTGTPSAATSENPSNPSANPSNPSSNPSNPSNPSTPATGQPGGTTQQLSVTNVKMVSSSCQGGTL